MCDEQATTRRLGEAPEAWRPRPRVLPGLLIAEARGLPLFTPLHLRRVVEHSRCSVNRSKRQAWVPTPALRLLWVPFPVFKRTTVRLFNR